MAPARGMRRWRTGAGLIWALVMSLECPAAWSRPLVAFVRPPDQAAINGPTPIEIAYRSDNMRPVVRIELLVDGREAQTDLLPSPLLEGQRSLTLNTAGLAPGVHRLTARAMDAAGEVGTAEITVSVLDTSAGPADRIPPAVSIYYPAHGSTVSGRVTIRADATDSSPLRGVFFYVDGKLHTVLMNTRPYEAKWDTTRVPDGPHILEARAKDAAGNEGVSAPVTVIVQNNPSSAPQPVTPGPTPTPSAPGPSVPGTGGTSPGGPAVSIPAVGPWSPGAGPSVISPPVAPGPTVVPPPAGPTTPGAAPLVAVPVRPAPPELAGPPAAWLQPAGAPVAPPTDPRVAAPPSNPVRLAAAYVMVPPAKLSPAVEAPAEAMMAPEATGPRPAGQDLYRTTFTPPPLPLPKAALAVPALAPLGASEAPAVAAMMGEPLGREPSHGIQTAASPRVALWTAAPVRWASPATGGVSEPAEALIDVARPMAPKQEAIAAPPPTAALGMGAARIAAPGLAALTEQRPLEEFALAEMVPQSGPQPPSPQPLRPTVALYAAGPRSVLPDIHLEAAAQGPAPAGGMAQPPAPAAGASPGATPAPQPTPAVQTAAPAAPSAGRPTLRRLGGGSGERGERGAGAPTTNAPPARTHRLTVSDASQLPGAKVTFEGKDLGDAGRPELIAGVLMVPLKALVEAADGALYWFANDRTARVVTPQVDMTVKVGSDKASINGEPRDLACAPILKDGRLMVPLNLAADVLGVVVDFDPAGREVILRRP